MTSKDVIVDVIDDWAEEVRRATVIRRNLLGPLADSIKMEEVSVVQGVRRSGKTFMLYGLMKEHGGTYINFEDERLLDFTPGDFDKLVDIVNQKDQRILYLDEVQEVDGWEKFAHRIHRKVKLFVTGSNSRLLSSDYSSGLVGRTKTFVSRPLMYNEFLDFTKLDGERESLLRYMGVGGFPRIVLTGDTGLAREYLERILYRDIMAKNDIRDPEALRAIADYLLSNVGKEFSFRSLKQVSGLKHETSVRDYISHLQRAFLLQVVNAYSASLKKQATYGKKVYAVDPGFITLGRRMGPDAGRVLENVVFNHLSPLGDVFFEKHIKETDFLLCDGLRPIRAVNVTFEAPVRTTVAREVQGLSDASKRYGIPAELVSVYPVEGLPAGIENRLAHQFLLELYG